MWSSGGSQLLYLDTHAVEVVVVVPDAAAVLDVVVFRR